jgi:site-specific DNA-cytosine methylase
MPRLLSARPGYQIFFAPDYFLAQTRKRLFIIGVHIEQADAALTSCAQSVVDLAMDVYMPVTKLETGSLDVRLQLYPHVVVTWHCLRHLHLCSCVTICVCSKLSLPVHLSNQDLHFMLQDDDPHVLAELHRRREVRSKQIQKAEAAGSDYNMCEKWKAMRMSLAETRAHHCTPLADCFLTCHHAVMFARACQPTTRNDKLPHD